MTTARSAWPAHPDLSEQVVSAGVQFVLYRNAFNL